MSLKTHATSVSQAAAIVLAASMIGAGGCGQQNTHRENISAQNSADTQAAFDDLAPAEALYTGDMRLARSHQSFAVRLQIKRVMDTVHVSQSPDPTETAQVPKLSGNLRFPAIDAIKNEDWTGFSEIIKPMGNLATMLFDYGDYNSKNRQIVLPYTVAGYSQGNFGELSGTLDPDTGHFQGTWFAKPFGTVGSFDLVRDDSENGGAPQ